MEKCKWCGCRSKLDRDGFCSNKCRTEYYKEYPSEYTRDKRKRKTKGCLSAIFILFLIFIAVTNKNDEEKTNDVKTEEVQSVKTNTERYSSSKTDSHNADEDAITRIEPDRKSSAESLQPAIKDTKKQDAPAVVNENTHSVEEINNLPDADLGTDSIAVSKKERRKNMRKEKRKSK